MSVIKRPRPVLDEAMISTIAALMRLGASHKTAAQGVGISPRTLQTWLQHGREAAEGPTADLARAVERAEAECTEEALRTVMEAVRRGDRRAAQWLLARREPELYGSKQTIEVKDGRGADHEAHWDRLSMEEMAVFEALCAKLEGRPEALIPAHPGLPPRAAGDLPLGEAIQLDMPRLDDPNVIDVEHEQG